MYAIRGNVDECIEVKNMRDTIGINFEKHLIPVGEEATAVFVLPEGEDEFIPRWLIIPPSIAPFFMIMSIKIGGKEQLGTMGTGIPAEVFMPEVIQPPPHFDMLKPGEKIEIRVRNCGDRPTHFLSAFSEYSQPR